MHPAVHQCVSRSLHPATPTSVYPSIPPSIDASSVHPSIHPSTHVYIQSLIDRSIHPSIHPSTRSSIPLSIQSKSKQIEANQSESKPNQADFGEGLWRLVWIFYWVGHLERSTRACPLRPWVLIFRQSQPPPALNAIGPSYRCV